MSLEFFHNHYPQGLEKEIQLNGETVLDIFDNFTKKYSSNIAFSCLGQEMTYAELDQYSDEMASFFQNHTSLKAGDRIAIQLPNILQYPVTIFGAIKAGLIVVNTNPLYTEREMIHQFNDSGAKGLVVLANMASKAESVLPETSIEKDNVIVTEVGDMHGLVKRTLINAVLKHVKKEVPAYNIARSTPFRKALALGKGGSHQRVAAKAEDTAVLQYTGGTTGVAKGAELTHNNLVANMKQCRGQFKLMLEEGGETAIAPLPMYHIYSFTIHCLVMLDTGNHNVLIPNPRDIDGFIKTLEKTKFTMFMGLNTLFNGLAKKEEFRNNVDVSGMKLTVSGGMALTKDVAEKWIGITDAEIAEGYGMTEASPVISFNPPGHSQVGTIGLPVASTDLKIVDDEGNEVQHGQAGEIWIKGPQVMKGYWKRPEETAKVITEDGWLKTGDVGVLNDSDGFTKIVDRKKDMIVVSGFNVYPNEIEDVYTSHPDVELCAVVGVPDSQTTEAVKLFVVKANDSLTEEKLRDHGKHELTGYKVPKHIEFRKELPTTNVGKVKRNELREEPRTLLNKPEMETA